MAKPVDKYTETEDEIIKKYYNFVKIEHILRILGKQNHTIYSLQQRMDELNLKKMNVVAPETISLIYKGKVSKMAACHDLGDLGKTFSKWFVEIRPALRRGETITIEIKTK